MTVWLTLRVALRALLGNRLRTVLTMLGIIIGVAAVIAMLSVGSGARHTIERSLERFGTNSVFIWPGHSRASMKSYPLETADWKFVDSLPDVKDSSPVIWTSVEMIYGNSSWSPRGFGVTPEYFYQRNFELESGRYFNQREIDSWSNVTVLGKDAKEELFGGTDPVGFTVRIGRHPFKIIGVLKEDESGAFGSTTDIAFMPYTTVIKKIENRDDLSFISLSAHSREEVKELQEKVKDALNRRHGVKNPEQGGFEAFNQVEMLERADETSRIFSMLLGGIAGISLLVGGIGVMNIMLVSVTERTREIGIRMAIGARGGDIMRQFLFEAIVLSVFGGAIGIALGYGFSHVIASYADWPPIVTIDSVVLAAGTSAAIGIFFGFYPAVMASKLDPIEALRYE